MKRVIWSTAEITWSGDLSGLHEKNNLEHGGNNVEQQSAPTLFSGLWLRDVAHHVPLWQTLALVKIS